MKTYEITVNGKVYQVTAKEVENLPQPAPAAASAPTPTPQPAPAAATGVAVNAPMPGVILGVSVKEGEAVKAGQVLLMLEAMKMENEIVAPQDGMVSAIHIKKGDQVEAGALLISL